MAILNGTTSDLRTTFLEVYSVLKAELLNDPVLEWTDDSRQWVERLQAYFLVHDDVMDNAQTWRSQPCWYRVPKVGMIAVNDGVILRNHIPRTLKKYFRKMPYYVAMLDLFNEIEFLTASGEMIDVITTLQGEKDLSKYSMDLWHALAHGRIEFGQSHRCKEFTYRRGNIFSISVEIGTDIEDFKCSWLVVKALEICNEEQKKILFEHYGKADPANVAKVKALYNDLNLQDVFAEYESESYERVTASIEAHPSKAVQAVLKSFLGKIYKRQK